MKNINNIVAVFAFLSGLIVAFRVDIEDPIQQQAWGSFFQACILGNLNESNCGTVVSPTRCKVTNGIQTVDAFDNNSFGKCIVPLYKQIR